MNEKTIRIEGWEILFFIMFIILAFLVMNTINRISIEREYREDLLLAGYYDRTGYTCIKQDLNQDLAEETKTHETCHALINQKPIHFCTNTKGFYGETLKNEINRT